MTLRRRRRRSAPHVPVEPLHRLDGNAISPSLERSEVALTRSSAHLQSSVFSREPPRGASFVFSDAFFLKAGDCFKRLPLYSVAQLIAEFEAISGRGRGDMPKFQCCVLVSSVPVTNFFLFSPWQQHRSGFPSRSPVIHFAGSLIVF